MRASGKLTARDRRELRLFKVLLRWRAANPKEPVARSLDVVYGRTLLEDIAPGVRQATLEAPVVRLRTDQRGVLQVLVPRVSEARAIIVVGADAKDLLVVDVRLGGLSCGVGKVQTDVVGPAESYIDLTQLDVQRMLRGGDVVGVEVVNRSSATVKLETFLVTRYLEVST